MPDQDIVDYIRENKSEYGIEALRRGLLKQGVSSREIKEAIETIENEEGEKISHFLNKDAIEDIEESEENVLLTSSGGGSEYVEKANQMIGAVTDVFGIAKRDKRVYIDSFKYGALAFLFLNLITILARYLGGRVIISQLVNNFGVSANLHFPNVFWSSIDIINWDFFGDDPSLIPSAIWALVFGGTITFLFIRFATNVWPFSNWTKLNQKIFYLYFIFNLIFGFLFKISFAEFSFRHLLGYIIVAIGITAGSYLASNYFTSVMDSKHGDKMRGITLKID